MTSGRRDTPGKVFDGILIALVLAGLCINILLLSHILGESAIAGCGGGACDEVLASRWSSLLGMPISVPGIGVYTLLLLSHVPRLGSLRAPMLGCVAGAALWFIGVQAFILGKFCPWCMAAHGVGIAVVFSGILSGGTGILRHVSAWAGLAVFAIASMQVFGPVRASHRLEGSVSAGANETFARNPEKMPWLGPSDAKHVMTAYFDYQCGTCRKLADYLAALMAKHPRSVAVRFAPVPLERRCNPFAPATTLREGSCEIASIMLSVWHHSPERFADFHRALLAEPTADAARRFALTSMESMELETLINDPRIGEAIRRNVAEWRGMARENPQLPKLLLRPGRVLHGLPPDEATFIELMERELGL